MSSISICLETVLRSFKISYQIVLVNTVNFTFTKTNAKILKIFLVPGSKPNLNFSLTLEMEVQFFFPQFYIVKYIISMIYLD